MVDFLGITVIIVLRNSKEESVIASIKHSVADDHAQVTSSCHCCC